MESNNKNKKINKSLSSFPSISKSIDEESDFAENIINTVREPLIVLDKELRVVKANRSFYNFFKVSPEETIGNLIYDLGNRQWDIPELKELLEKILPEKTTFDNFQVDHDFTGIGNRILLLNARQIERAFGKEKIILLAIEDITERKHLEETLSEKSRMTSEYLDILVNHAHFPIVIWDSSFIITRFNNSFEKLSGYDVSEVMGKKIDFLFPENTRESTLNLLKNSLHEEKFEIMEIDILRKDKEIRTVLWNSANVFDKDGRIIIATIAQDINERKRVEDALKESEEIFNHFMKNSPYYVFFKDKNIRTIRLSTNYEQMFGKPLNSILGKTMEELFPSELAKKMIEVDKEILNKRETVIVEEEFNGRYFTTIKFPIIINDIPQYLAGFTIDITEQKRAEAALMENEKFLKETQKIAMLGSYTFNVITGIWKSSDILDAIFGIEPDYYKSVEGWTSIIHPEWQQLMMDYLVNEVIGLRKAFDKEYKIVRKSDKSERWVHGLGELVVDNENRPIKMIGTIRDITELKNAEQEIVNLNRVYALLSNTNVAIVRVKDRQKLFNEICRIAIDNGKFRMAWIGIVNNDTNIVDVKASAGLIENYLEDINIDLNDETRSGGPTGKAIRNETNIIVNDIENDKDMLPWKENALRLGYKSCAIFPLIVFGKVFGVFSIYASQKDFFQQQEIRLLDEMAMDISFAVEFLETEKNRKAAEKKLRISEERFRSLYENSTIGLYRTTPDGTILMANKVLVKMLGFSSFEKLARRNLEKDGFEQSYERKEFLERIEKYGEINDFESIWSRQDGSKFYVRESAQAIRDSHGSTLYYDGVVEDITERKQAEEKIREKDIQFRKLSEQVPDLIFQFTRRPDVTYFVPIASEGIKNIFGCSPEDVLEDFTPIARVIFPDDLNRVISDIEYSAKHLSPFTCEFRVQIPGKSIQWIHSKSKPEKLDDGSITWYGFNTDITDHKRAEEELLKLSLAVEQSPESIIITDTEGNIEYINPKVTEITGYRSEEVIGKNPRIFTSGEKTKSEYKTLWDTITSGNEWRGEFHNKKKNGELYWESASISPIIDEKGIITHYLAVKEDITDQKRVAKELLKAKDKAEESDKLKSEFLAQMSHEIRTPLNAIVGNSDFLHELLGENINSDTKDCFDGIELASKRIIRTVDLILNFSELEKNSYKAHFKIINIHSEILYKLYQESQLSAKQKGLELTYHCITAETMIKGDEYSVTQIFSHLIDNAINYTQKGKVEIILSKGDNGKIIVEVIDTGIGISKEFLSKMFKPFLQEEQGYTRSYEGNGLGLALVKKYCEINFATIEVESEKNKGSIFRVIFDIVI